MPTLKSPPRKRTRGRAAIKQILRRAFKDHFAQDTVDVSDGYKDLIHVIVVSRQFDKMSEREKPAFMWRIIDNTDLNDAEKSLISLVLPLSPRDLV